MMRITLRGCPPSLNQFVGKVNGNEYRAAKSQWTRTVYYLAKASKDRPAEPYKLADVEIMYYFPDRRRHDPDNYAGKLLLDGLTKAGVIEDDSFDHIRLHVAGGYDKRDPRTVITVREVERNNVNV